MSRANYSKAHFPVKLFPQELPHPTWPPADRIVPCSPLNFRKKTRRVQKRVLARCRQFGTRDPARDGSALAATADLLTPRPLSPGPFRDHPPRFVRLVHAAQEAH